MVGSVLTTLHDLNNTVHRDIKPQNILVDRRRAIRLIDFGLAKIVKEIDRLQTVSSLNVGTRDFASPEAWGMQLGCYSA